MRRRIALIILIPLALGLLSGNTTANAQRASAPAATLSSGYELAWYTIAGGASLSSGGSLALEGSLGQPAAGALSGGAYAIQGGFWAGAVLAQYHLYLPLAQK